MVTHTPHFRCGKCLTDFGSLVLFDLHREKWRVTRNQELVGYCLTPEDLGLVKTNGTWWSVEGAAKSERMSAVAKARRKNVEG